MVHLRPLVLNRLLCHLELRSSSSPQFTGGRDAVLMTSFSVGFEIEVAGLSFFGLFGSGDLSEKTMLSKLKF